MRSDSYFLRPIIVLHGPVAIVLNLNHKRGIRLQKNEKRDQADLLECTFPVVRAFAKVWGE